MENLRKDGSSRTASRRPLGDINVNIGKDGKLNTLGSSNQDGIRPKSADSNIGNRFDFDFFSGLNLEKFHMDVAHNNDLKLFRMKKEKKIENLKPLRSFTIPAPTKITMRSSRKLMATDGPGYIDEENLMDIIQISKEQEKKSIVPSESNFAGFRSDIINWLFLVQMRYQLNSAEIYIAINLLDRVWSKIPLNFTDTQLASLVVTCLKLSNKFYGYRQISTAQLVDLEWNDITAEVFKMEISILKGLDYSIHWMDPSSIINCYLGLMKLDHNIEHYRKTHTILDFAVHLPTYSTYPASLVGIASILMAFSKFYTNEYQKVKSFLKRELPSLKEEFKCKLLQTEIEVVIDFLKFKNEGIIIKIKKN